MPQKLVVIYDAKLRAGGGAPLGSVTQQLTLLIPTFTRCSSILRTLTEILTNNDVKKPAHAHHGEASKHGHGRKGHAKNKPKHGKKVKEIEATPPSNKFRQTDTLVQYYLKLLLSQESCFELEGLKKSDINKLKLMYVTLRRTSLLTRDFFKQHVPYRGKSASSSADQDESSFFSFLKSDEPPPDIRDAQTIVNCTVLFFICDRLFLLKEDLNRWSYLKAQEPNVLKAYHKNLLKEIQAQRTDGRPYCHVRAQSEGQIEPNFSDTGGLSRERAEQRHYHESNYVPMFDVLLCIHVEDVDKIMVHKGREPSVDIRCYGDKKWHICLVFTGDMERQMFLDQIFEIKKKVENPANGKTSDDGDESMQMLGRAKKTAKPDDDDSSIADDSESEEEVVEQAIYD